MISGEPCEIRNFLDELLVFAIPHYARVMSKYKTALVTRNRVIQSILDGEAKKSDLSSWNTLFAEYAVEVIRERRKFFEWFSEQTLDGLNLPGPARIELVERHPLPIVDQEHFLELIKNYTERDLIV